MLHSGFHFPEYPHHTDVAFQLCTLQVVCTYTCRESQWSGSTLACLHARTEHQFHQPMSECSDPACLIGKPGVPEARYKHRLHSHAVIWQHFSVRSCSNNSRTIGSGRTALCYAILTSDVEYEMSNLSGEAAALSLRRHMGLRPTVKFCTVA